MTRPSLSVLLGQSPGRTSLTTQTEVDDVNTHPSIRAYFDADESLDGGAPLHVFVPDAVIEDDGHTHTGHAAIDAWWRDAKVRIGS